MDKETTNKSSSSSSASLEFTSSDESSSSQAKKKMKKKKDEKKEKKKEKQEKNNKKDKASPSGSGVKRPLVPLPAACAAVLPVEGVFQDADYLEVMKVLAPDVDASGFPSEHEAWIATAEKQTTLAKINEILLAQGLGKSTERTLGKKIEQLLKHTSGL